MGHPRTPLPEAWNPWVPLRVTAPLSPLTNWKLRVAVATPQACLAALEPLDPTEMQPLVESDVCGIDPRVRITRAADADVAPVETTCAVALRLAMWDRHAVQPAARRHFSVGVDRISHQSSYVCREIRNPDGSGGRMSTHATAEAIDVNGFILQNSEKIMLLRDWDGPDAARRAFLRDVQKGACRWFVTTLGPEYNALHRDHFHMQSLGWGLCR